MQTSALIGGAWTKAADGSVFAVTDPATGEVITSVVDCGPKEATAAVDAAVDAYPAWRRTTPKARGEILLKIESLLMSNQKQLAELITRENGKPLAESMGEVGFAASFFGWFAGEGRRAYGETVPSPAATKEMIHIREPVGVVAMITPWNFPIGMLARKAAAAMAAGCSLVLKPAEDTPLISLAVAQLIVDVVPKGVVNVVPCSRKNVVSVGEVFCTHPAVRVVSFTGSTEVGKWIAEKCASSVKRVALELGGNAPFIVFPSADMEAAVTGCMAAKFRNTGQTCVTANRIFVARSIHDTFVAGLKAKMTELKVGNGMTAGNTQGPLINKKQYDRVAKLLASAVSEGCKVELGGALPHPLGQTFFPPTLLTGARADMTIAREEIFGPVMVIIPFDTEEEVVKLANDTTRGLAGYFYSEDLSQVFRVARAMEVGMVGVNEPAISSCEAAFGGVKESGIGKEGSCYGLDEYTHVKYICIGGLKL